MPEMVELIFKYVDRCYCDIFLRQAIQVIDNSMAEEVFLISKWLLFLNSFGVCTCRLEGPASLKNCSQSLFSLLVNSLDVKIKFLPSLYSREYKSRILILNMSWSLDLSPFS